MKYESQINSLFNNIDNDYLIDLICEFSRIKSVWDPKNGFSELEAALWIEKKFKEFGFETDFYYVTDKRPNVIAELNYVNNLNSENSNIPTLLLEGHTDVVTEGDSSLWSVDPFSATIKNGRIIGRGVNDMKSGLICALYAMKLIKDSDLELNGNLICAALCDEEGEMIGVKDFVQSEYADRISSVIVCEPEANNICIEQKGVAWISIKIIGKMSHGAMPYSGLNTSYPLANILTECEKLNDQLKEHKSILLGYPSITPTIISSPGLNNGIPQNNVMPGESEMILDIRLTPEIDLEYILDRFDSIIKNAKLKYDSNKFTYEILESRPPVKVDTNSKIVKALSDSYKFVTGNPPVIAGVPGSTDGTIISKEKNIPVVVCGPGAVTAPHQIDEYIDISEIKESIRIYISSIINYLEIKQ